MVNNWTKTWKVNAVSGTPFAIKSKLEDKLNNLQKEGREITEVIDISQPQHNSLAGVVLLVVSRSEPNG